MSTSSRKKAIELWQVDIPTGDKEKLAKTFSASRILREQNM
jgi:hypothetical protein